MVGSGGLYVILVAGTIQGSKCEHGTFQTPHQADARRSVGSQVAVVDLGQQSLDQVAGLSLFGSGKRHGGDPPR